MERPISPLVYFKTAHWIYKRERPSRLTPDYVPTIVLTITTSPIPATKRQGQGTRHITAARRHSFASRLQRYLLSLSHSLSPPSLSLPATCQLSPWNTLILRPVDYILFITLLISLLYTYIYAYSFLEWKLSFSYV